MKKISCLIVFLICSLSNLLRKFKRNFKNLIEMLISEGSSSSSSSSSSSEDENNSILNQNQNQNPRNLEQNAEKIIRLKRWKKLRKWAKDDHMMLYTFKPYKMVHLKYDKNLKYPAARSGHRIICTESNIYLLGGFNPDMASIARPAAACLFTEFWKYNIATRKWELLVDRRTKNMPRELASNAIVMYRNAVIAHGGTGFPFGEANSNNTHIFGTQTSLVRKLKCSGDFPWPQYGPSLVIHDDNLYTIGGTTGYDYFCDIYRLDLKTNEWASIYISRPELREDPEGRYRHETIYTGKHILILGGGTSHINYDLKKLPAFDLEKNCWEYIETKPDPSLPQRLGFPKSRKCFSCIQYEVTDVNENRAIEAIIAGGLGNNNAHLSDIWKFKVSTMTWQLVKDDKLNKPTYFHSAATAGNGAMYIFGGIEVRNRDSMERTNDMYKMWTTIPKLSEMCWDAITYYDSYLDRYSKDQLLKFGIPLEFANRIEHSSNSTKDSNRMKYRRLFENHSVLFQSPTKRFRSLSQ